MKNVKEKHLPVSKSITTDEPQTSSIKLALQQFKKEAEKKRLLRKRQKYVVGFALKKLPLSVFVLDMEEVAVTVKMIVLPLIKPLRKKQVMKQMTC